MAGEQLAELFDEMITFQEDKLLKLASRIMPHLTGDDLLQPNDYDQLEHHPVFRYEEGVLKGIQAAKMAVLAKTRGAQTGDSECM